MADAAELERWREILTKIPEDLRGGPYFALGRALAANGQSEAAAIALMRVPILYAGDSRRLSAAALLYAGRELTKIDRTEEAASLYREILRDYAKTPAAADANAQLKRLSAEG
jgi:TolA-binding protein